VTLDGSGSTDADGHALTYLWSGTFGTASGVSPSVDLALGVHTITLTVDDGHGGTDTDTVEITVQDTTAPAIVSITPSKTQLNTHNHRMRTVTFTVVATDAVDAAPVSMVVAIGSDEPESGLGPKDKSPDWKIRGPLKVRLRAERDPDGDGRVYTITIRCTDASGNSSEGQVTVTVPL
jgi:hypothetical protein